jgi:hypothetical protein
MHGGLETQQAAFAAAPLPLLHINVKLGAN